MFRDHLKVLIERDLELKVCGVADSAAEAFKLARDIQPDVAIVDITLKDSSGLEFIKDAKAHWLGIKILVLSMHDESLYAERALRAGAMGYISKNEASSEVIDAIRCVLGGEVYASRAVTTRLLGRMTRHGEEKSTVEGLETLADRELEVFRWLGRGKTNRDIAKMLNLGESTIETYRSRIKTKLGLSSAAELYLRAGQWVREHGG